MLFMYDAAYAPDFAKVKAKGGIAVNGYLTGLYENTTSQAADAHKAGLGFVPTYELGADELVNAPRTKGQEVGRRILAAFKREGIPTDGTVAVYPSVDVNVSSATACDKAWRGIRDILAGKIQVRYYGEGRIGDHLFDTGLLDGKYWLAAPSSWPGYDGANDTKRVCLLQLVGTPVPGTDKNQIIGNPADIGAWWPAGHQYDTATIGGTGVSKQDVLDALADPKGKQLIGRALLDAIVNLDEPTKDARLERVIAVWHRWLTMDTHVLGDPSYMAKVAQAVIAKLPPGQVALTQDQITAALREVFADAATDDTAGSNQ